MRDAGAPPDLARAEILPVAVAEDHPEDPDMAPAPEDSIQGLGLGRGFGAGANRWPQDRLESPVDLQYLRVIAFA